MPDFSANITNSYGLSATPNVSVSVSGSGGVRTRTIRFLGESFGGTNGSSAFGNIQPRTENISNTDAAAYELGMTVQFQWAGEIASAMRA